MGYHINLVCLSDVSVKPLFKEILYHQPKTMMETMARLRPDTTYTLGISVINENGRGPEARVNVTTRPSIIGVESREWFLIVFFFA